MEDAAAATKASAKASKKADRELVAMRETVQKETTSPGGSSKKAKARAAAAARAAAEEDFDYSTFAKVKGAASPLAKAASPAAAAAPARVKAPVIEAVAGAAHPDDGDWTSAK
jgi:hypothetical protein